MWKIFKNINKLNNNNKLLLIQKEGVCKFQKAILKNISLIIILPNK